MNHALEPSREARGHDRLTASATLARSALLTIPILLVLVAISATPRSAHAQIATVQPGDLVLRGGWLFDGRSDEVRRNRGIVIRRGRLMSVDRDLSGADLTGATVRDLADDQYVLPGLFDLHAHYAIDLLGEGRIDEYDVNPVIFLANGVTSTFPAGEVDPVGMRRARERIDAGEQVGPRIYNSGPYFGTARPGWRAASMTPDSITTEVDLWAARGARGFKAKGIQPAQLEALIAAAHRHGLTVTGHLDSGFRSSVNPRDAIAMGIDRVEHFMGGDAITGERPAYSSLEQLDVTRPEVAAIIRTYLDNNVFYDATLTAYGYYGKREPVVYTQWADEMSFLTPHARDIVKSKLPRRVNEQFERIYHVKRKEIKAFFDAGGGRLITLGTDHPSWGEFLSGFASHRELHAMVLAGIPPAAALRIGTINGARALGVSDRLGTIEPGKLADLFVIQGNPLADIRNTHNVRLVIKDGKTFDPAALLASVRNRLGPESASEDDAWKGNVRYAQPDPDSNVDDEAGADDAVEDRAAWGMRREPYGHRKSVAPIHGGAPAHSRSSNPSPRGGRVQWGWVGTRPITPDDASDAAACDAPASAPSAGAMRCSGDVTCASPDTCTSERRVSRNRWNGRF